MHLTMPEEPVCIAIAPSGQAAMLIGPESETYVRGRSTVGNIYLLTE